MNLPAENLNSGDQNPRSIRTLLVDDSPVILKTLSLFLKRQDRFTVVGAVPDGRQALQYTVALEPDLILMDVHMPHLNGIETTRYIKQMKNPPKVIVTTSDESPGCREMAEAAGADGFITKAGAKDIHRQLQPLLQALFRSVSGPTAAAFTQ
jgi:CheY-like chemotaxis protein